ncbi:hypothetical protein F5148DRAFT_1239409 [Russula earlei]|uniref:Uncharacterized protein n=1 Tax=Russula earlei TaxID=71964 RepID=A0ACC0TX67_9AGAM|nr:hypothetical protein F5148DRAFT_1239409 [Russula earlei]
MFVYVPHVLFSLAFSPSLPPFCPSRPTSCKTTSQLSHARWSFKRILSVTRHLFSLSFFSLPSPLLLIMSSRSRSLGAHVRGHSQAHSVISPAFKLSNIVGRSFPPARLSSVYLYRFHCFLSHVRDNHMSE